MKNFKARFGHFLKKSLTYIFLLPLIISGILLITPESSEAASGGRIGGGEFRAPSIPTNGFRRNYGAYDQGYRYRNNGIGFPFLLPIFGFGGGGLFGFLILMTISGVIVNAIRGGSLANNTTQSTNKDSPTTNSVTMVQLQIGLLARAHKLQAELRKLAKDSDTSTSSGLEIVLQETTLALLRQTDLLIYANIEKGIVPFSASESTFNRLSITERGKLTAETSSNFSGKIGTFTTLETKPGEADNTSEFIAVSILIATTMGISINEKISSVALSDNLRAIGSIPSKELLALEIIWQPDGENESLTREDLVTSYPNLKHL